MTGLRLGVLTVSDLGSQGLRDDVSGDTIRDWILGRGGTLAHRTMVPDETSAIVPVLLRWCDSGEVDLVITTGGTGFSPRDVTAEAMSAVVQRNAPGLSERIRRTGEASTPYAVLSRGVAGVRGKTLLVSLPGSPGGVRDGLAVLDALVDHAVGLLREEPTPHLPSPQGERSS